MLKSYPVNLLEKMTQLSLCYSIHLELFTLFKLVSYELNRFITIEHAVMNVLCVNTV